MDENIRQKIKECFLVQGKIQDEEKECFLIYAPLQMMLFAVNEEGRNAFFQLKRDKVVPGAEKILELLKNSKFNLVPSDLNRIPNADITICPTFRCQLRCLYCFAKGGERINDLSLNAAKAAIDLVLDLGIILKSQISRLVWHGGGEPTLAWELLKEVSLYHRQKAITLGIKPRLSIVSNGIWTQEKRQWIINNFDRITVSCDGPSEIQNKQRPFFNGSSSDQVYGNLRFLAEQKANFGIRATITEYNVRQMPAMVQFFYDLCKPKVIQFERLTVSGRCEQSKIEPGSTKDFIDYFKEAFKIAKSLNIGLISSGTRIFRRTKYYCGVAGYSFCVTPEGFLTTCHRVDNLLHPLANELIFGKWDENKKQYEWRENQLFKLRKELSVDNFKECQQCFCKYTCGGGCFARRAIDTNLQENCQIIQELTQFRLLAIAEEKGICKQVI